MNLSPDDPRRARFYLLQIRPIVDSKEMIEEDLSVIPEADTLISSRSVLGNGIISDVQDIIYVKSNAFDAADNQLVVYEIEKLNRKLLDAGRGYILVGPGRWGSSDPWLGIPVKWPHICAARLIVECGRADYRVDPSQGTHFFQNLTSFGVGYFTVNPYRGDGRFDEAALNAMPAEEETAHLRHVRAAAPLVIKMDGRKSLGVVMR